MKASLFIRNMLHRLHSMVGFVLHKSMKMFRFASKRSHQLLKKFLSLSYKLLRFILFALYVLFDGVSVAILLLMLILLWGALCIPVALFANSFPNTWRPNIAYVIAGWIIFMSIVIVGDAALTALKEDSREELIKDTVWRGTKYCYVVFIILVLQYAGAYWTIDRLCPGEHFPHSGGVIDWLYFSLMAGLGGNIEPVSWLSRSLVSIQILLCIILLGSFIGILASLRAGEIQFGYAKIWRHFQKMRNSYIQSKETYGTYSPETLCIFRESARVLCQMLDEQNIFMREFLFWLSRDIYAKIFDFGVAKQDEEIVLLSSPELPLVNIISEFSREGSWNSWINPPHDKEAYKVTSEGFIRLFKLVSIDEGEIDYKNTSFGYTPIGSFPFGFKKQTSQWEEIEVLTPETFSAKLLGYFERYLIEVCRMPIEKVFH